MLSPEAAESSLGSRICKVQLGHVWNEESVQSSREWLEESEHVFNFTSLSIPKLQQNHRRETDTILTASFWLLRTGCIYTHPLTSPLIL